MKNSHLLFKFEKNSSSFPRSNMFKDDYYPIYTIWRHQLQRVNYYTLVLFHFETAGNALASHMVRCALLNSRAERPENNRLVRRQPGSGDDDATVEIQTNRQLDCWAVSQRWPIWKENKIDREKRAKENKITMAASVRVRVPCVSQITSLARMMEEERNFCLSSLRGEESVVCMYV